LLFAVFGFFAILVSVLNDALEEQKIRAALAGQLNAVAVVPLDGALEDFAVVQNDGHGRARLHLLYPIEIFRVSRFGRRGLLAGGGAAIAVVVMLGAGRRLFLRVRKTGTEHPAVHHDYSLIGGVGVTG